MYDPHMGTTRLSVNINDETAEALRKWAEHRQTTVTEIVRRAVSVYDRVERETRDGARLQMVKGKTVTTFEFV